MLLIKKSLLVWVCGQALMGTSALPPECPNDWISRLWSHSRERHGFFHPWIGQMMSSRTQVSTVCVSYPEKKWFKWPSLAFFVQRWSVSYTDCVGVKELEVRTRRARAVPGTSPKELEIGWHSTLAVPECSTEELRSKAHGPLNPLESSAATVQYTVLSPPNAVQCASVVLYILSSPLPRTAGVTETESGQCDHLSQESLICPWGPSHYSPSKPTVTHCAPGPHASRSSTLAPVFRTPQANHLIKCLSDVYYKPRIQWTSSTLKKVPSPSSQSQVCLLCHGASSQVPPPPPGSVFTALNPRCVTVPRCKLSRSKLSSPSASSWICVHGSQSQVCLLCHGASSQVPPPPPGSVFTALNPRCVTVPRCKLSRSKLSSPSASSWICVHGSQSQVGYCATVQALTEQALKSFRLLLDLCSRLSIPGVLLCHGASSHGASSQVLPPPPGSVFTALNPRCVTVPRCKLSRSKLSSPSASSWICVHGSQSQVCYCATVQALTEQALKSFRLLLDLCSRLSIPGVLLCHGASSHGASSQVLPPPPGSVFTALNPRCLQY